MFDTDAGGGPVDGTHVSVLVRGVRVHHLPGEQLAGSQGGTRHHPERTGALTGAAEKHQNASRCKDLLTLSQWGKFNSVKNICMYEIELTVQN